MALALLNRKNCDITIWLAQHFHWRKSMGQRHVGVFSSFKSNSKYLANSTNSTSAATLCWGLLDAWAPSARMHPLLPVAALSWFWLMHLSIWMGQFVHAAWSACVLRNCRCYFELVVTICETTFSSFPPFAWALSWSGLHLPHQVQPTATRLKSALNIAASFLNRFRAHHRKNVVCTWLATFSASSQEPGCSWKYEKIHSWSRGHGNKCDWMLGLRYWYMRLYSKWWSKQGRIRSWVSNNRNDMNMLSKILSNCRKQWSPSIVSMKQLGIASWRIMLNRNALDILGTSVKHLNTNSSIIFYNLPSTCKQSLSSFGYLQSV